MYVLLEKAIDKDSRMQLDHNIKKISGEKPMPWWKAGKGCSSKLIATDQFPKARKLCLKDGTYSFDKLI